MKRCIATFSLVLLTACGSSEPDSVSNSSSSTVASFSTSSTVNIVVDTVYTNAEDGYQILQPANWQAEQNVTLTTPTQEYVGTAFRVPQDWWLNTVVFDAYVHVTSIPSCVNTAETETVNEDGKVYLYSEWQEGAAGSLHTGNVYQIEADDSCLQFTLYQLRCNLGPACSQQQFTRDDELQSVVNDMFDSLQTFEG